MLTYDPAKENFVLYTKDKQKAFAAGLVHSRDVRMPNGDYVFYTGDYDNAPVFNPYAVLDFYDEADKASRSKLDNLARDYRSSWDDGLGGEDYPDVPVPEGLEYLPYQKAGIAYALKHKNCIIGDEPGLGKTIQAIGLANAIEARNVLVLCPASIRRNWSKEIGIWSTMQRKKVKLIEKSKSGIEPGNWTVCSYDLARVEGVQTALYSQNWDLIVCDEGHFLKTIDAARTRAVFGSHSKEAIFYKKGLINRTKRIISLTGTPLPNRPRECYTMARGLDWSSIDFLSEEPFQFRYNQSGRFNGKTVEEKARLPELQARLRCNIMVRRHKKDVLPQLPPKHYEMTYLEPNGRVQKILKAESLVDFDPNDLFNPDFSLEGTPISTLRREMGEAMLPEMIEYIRYLLDVVEVPKLPVFAHHTSVIEGLAAGLHKYGVLMHHGKMSSRKKDEALVDFVNGKPRVIICQNDTMEGVDGLQGVADQCVNAEPAWTPGRNEQLVDRIHRIGQTMNVLAHFLLIEGSFNEKVLNAVMGKAESIHEALDRRLLT